MRTTCQRTLEAGYVSTSVTRYIAYRRGVALDGSVPFRLRLRATLWAADQYVQAMEQGRAVVSADPENAEAHMALGAAHIKMGDPVEGCREYQRVLALVPDHAGARQALARMGTR